MLIIFSASSDFAGRPAFFSTLTCPHMPCLSKYGDKYELLGCMSAGFEAVHDKAKSMNMSCAEMHVKKLANYQSVGVDGAQMLPVGVGVKLIECLGHVLLAMLDIALELDVVDLSVVVCVVLCH